MVKSMSLSVIILAAGKGTRMRSNMPKVLHEVGGVAMVQHAINLAAAVGSNNTVVVYGHGGDQLQKSLAGQSLTLVEQAEQLGTAHAVQQAMPHIPDEDEVLILYGDVPLLSSTTTKRLLKIAEVGALAVLTAQLNDPTGYGRIVRNARGKVCSIVEHKDATPEQHQINEINTGIMSVDADYLRDWLNRVDNNNAQNEYYLTDIVELAVADGIPVAAAVTTDEDEVSGVNNRLQLAAAERVYQARIADTLMTNGATLRDPARVDVRGTVETGTDVIIDINVVMEGSVSIADNVSIGPNVVLKNCTIGAGTDILANSIIEDAVIGADCNIGPYARLRPGSNLADKAKVGNFVELKNTTLGEGSKVNHLSYVGDATVGTGVNVGAGTITCNYDGVNKSKTIIGDGAFIGSGSELVAPITIGSGATVGAGSTLSKDVPDAALAIERAKLRTLNDWPRPTKKESN